MHVASLATCLHGTPVWCHPQDGAHQRRIHHLEAQLERHQKVESVSRAANEDLVKAQHQIESLKGQCRATDARVSIAEAEALRLQRLLDSKAGEMQNLELAMGEVTYEAESARGAELRSRQLQVRLCFSSRARMWFVGSHALHTL
jgi:chromosome segregation ATPase